MFGLDEQLSGLAGGGTFALVAVVAVLLGLRHATDPDHLTAVITLMANGDREPRGGRRAAWMGLAWGGGHAVSLMALGLPVVLFGRYLPGSVQRGAEVLVGLVIIALSLRLLLRLHRSHVHEHAHRHDGDEHVHRHVHETAGAHDHHHGAVVSRTGREAFAVGLVHGVGGSAGVGVLLLAGIPDAVQGTIALALFCALTAVSMALAATAFGALLARRRFAPGGALMPALGVGSLAFGVWYVLGAMQLVPYVL